ncbi:MAG TPA: ATP synthase F0 subunit C [Bryobacteraceae bacterium]|nr:ATP synthase F0 subunit C [Bryobacteraceae bacterium]
MTKKMFFLLALMLLASPFLFAQTPGAPAAAADSHWAIVISAGISMAFASGLCALAQGKAVAGASEALARNPAATGAIRFALVLGLVLIESLALYTLVIIILKVQ